MAVLKTEDFMAAIKSVVGDRSDDEAIKFIEDASDTITSLTSGEDWKAKYEENDAAWRTRYRDRFFGANTAKDEYQPDSTRMNPQWESGVVQNENMAEEKTSYDDLFVTN